MLSNASRCFRTRMPEIRHIFNEVHFELVRRIAEGGMGIVYEARQRGASRFEKRVAVKLIREEFSEIEEFRNNFIGEALLAADLIHTNIVQIYHLGEISGQYFMVMEFVDGMTLEQFIQNHREREIPVPPDLAAFIISRVCRGLAYAHRKRHKDNQPLNIVHRDVNPKNIMLSVTGGVKLTDFGIAKALNLMHDGEGHIIPGKPEYTSPEQANYECTDGRADLFSLGVVLSEVLLGRNIFLGEDSNATWENIRNMALPHFPTLRKEIGGPLNDLLTKALERERENRYASAIEMLYDLELYLYSEGFGTTNEKLAGYLQNLSSHNLQRVRATSD